MYERSYGYRYAEADDLCTVDIAKLIRCDVKQAVSEGLLPSRWTYSVRSPHGTSIDVEVRDCLDAWQECDGRDCHDVWCAARRVPGYEQNARPHLALTEEAKVARMTLERIHGAYNHDGSELQTDYFDVRYYGHVEFEDPQSAEWRAQHKAEQEARKVAKESGRIVGKVTNYGRERATTHLLVETDAGKQVLACGARMWRHSHMSRAHDDATVTCSRCARREARV